MSQQRNDSELHVSTGERRPDLRETCSRSFSLEHEKVKCSLEPGDDLELQTHFIIYVLSLDREDQACSATQQHTQTHNRLADVGLWVYHPHVCRAHFKLNILTLPRSCSTLFLTQGPAAASAPVGVHTLAYKRQTQSCCEGGGVIRKCNPSDYLCAEPPTSLHLWKLNLHSL